MLDAKNPVDIERLIEKINLLEDELQMQTASWLMVITDTQQHLIEGKAEKTDLAVDSLEQLSFGLEIQSSLWNKPLKEIRDSLASIKVA